MMVALALIIVPERAEASDIQAHVSGAGEAPHNGIALERTRPLLGKPLPLIRGENLNARGLRNR